MNGPSGRSKRAARFDCPCDTRSTEKSFVVTLKNLNYSKALPPRGDEVGVDNKVDITLTAITAEPKDSRADPLHR